MSDLEEGVDLEAPESIATIQPWKAEQVRAISDPVHSSERLNGTRIVLGVLEVHDVVRDALARALFMNFVRFGRGSS